MKTLKNIMAAFAALIVLSFAAQAQLTQGQLVPLGGYLQDGQGNLYQVVLQPVPKAAAAPVAAPAPAPVVTAPVAAAPVAAAPVVQPQVVYVQQAAPAQQQQSGGLLGGTGLGDIPLIGGLLPEASSGFVDGTVTGVITGRDPLKEGAGRAAGSAAGQLGNKLLWGK